MLDVITLSSPGLVPCQVMCDVCVTGFWSFSADHDNEQFIVTSLCGTLSFVWNGLDGWMGFMSASVFGWALTLYCQTLCCQSSLYVAGLELFTEVTPKLTCFLRFDVTHLGGHLGQCSIRRSVFAFSAANYNIMADESIYKSDATPCRSPNRSL
jgi:hypothetical protein